VSGLLPSGRERAMMERRSDDPAPAHGRDHRVGEAAAVASTALGSGAGEARASPAGANQFTFRFTHSMSSSIATSSPTTQPPASRALFQSRPKSLRLTVVTAEAPIF